MQSGSCPLDSEQSDPLCGLYDEIPESCASMLQQFIKYTRTLQFDQDPDYAYLKGLLKDAYKHETGDVMSCAHALFCGVLRAYVTLLHVLGETTHGMSSGHSNFESTFLQRLACDS